MNTRAFEYFIAAAEEGCIAKAAERCFVSQSALSQQIQKIEKEVGTALFTHGRKGLQLTPSGKVYLNHARAIIFTQKQMLDELDRLKKT